MKLNKLLPIVALSGIATVAMPLVSCSKPEQDKSVEFNIVESETISETNVTLSLDWNPSGDSINFSNITASSKKIAVNEVQFHELEKHSRPQQIDLSFKKEIVEDLDDVVIEFDYEDTTQKISNHAKLENIQVDKYSPDTVINLTINDSVASMPFIRSEEMNIISGKKYNIKVDMSQFTTAGGLPYANWFFGFGILIYPGWAGANVDENSTDNIATINNNPVATVVSDPGLDFNSLSISDNVDGDDIILASLVFKNNFSGGYFFMCRGM